MAEDANNIDTSDVKCKLNDHNQIITGIRFNDGWLEIGLQDSTTQHCQCIKFELKSLAYIFDKVSSIPGFVGDAKEFFTDLGNRFSRAVDAFSSEDKSNKK